MLVTLLLLFVVIDSVPLPANRFSASLAAAAAVAATLASRSSLASAGDASSVVAYICRTNFPFS